MHQPQNAFEQAEAHYLIKYGKYPSTLECIDIAVTRFYYPARGHYLGTIPENSGIF
jgi:hypothetical protein